MTSIFRLITRLSVIRYLIKETFFACSRNNKSINVPGAAAMATAILGNFQRNFYTNNAKIFTHCAIK